MKLIFGVISLMGFAASLNMHRQEETPAAETVAAPSA